MKSHIYHILFIGMLVGFIVLGLIFKKLTSHALYFIEKADLLEKRVQELEFEIVTNKMETTVHQHDIALLDSKVDTLETVIDKDKKRKVQITKIVAVIKSSMAGINPCPETMNSGELLRIAGAVMDFSERYAVPAALILGVIRQESAFCQKAISSVGAQGYMQLMPDTATQVSQDIGISLNVWSSRDNIHLGVAYLSSLLTIFHGDIDLATKAYNAGPTHVKKVVAGITKEYHPESLDYSKKVINYMRFYEAAGVSW